MPFGNSEMNVPEGQMKIAQRFVCVYRSADFQSAVSPIWNRQGADHSQDARFCRHSAGYKPAIQQTTSLRYQRRRPGKHVQRFIAGCSSANETSPVRDERNRLFGDTLLSPRGLCRLGIRNCRLGIRNPRLKPWAGLLSGCPCGTNFRRIFERHSD